MNRAIPYIAGVCIILLFSLYPIRLADSICCLGVVLGGLLSAVLTARDRDGRMESAQALAVGAWTGVYAAVVVLLLNLLIWGAAAESIRLDPVPDYFYRFFWELAEAMFDIAGSSRLADDLPGIWGRFTFQVFSNGLFGAFGGAIGASLFQQEAAAAA